jgi:hypothetical protein
MTKYKVTEKSQLSEEALERLVALNDRPIDSSDIPELTLQVDEIRRQREQERKSKCSL